MNTTASSNESSLGEGLFEFDLFWVHLLVFSFVTLIGIFLTIPILGFTKRIYFIRFIPVSGVNVAIGGYYWTNL